MLQASGCPCGMRPYSAVRLHIGVIGLCLHKGSHNGSAASLCLLEVEGQQLARTSASNWAGCKLSTSSVSEIGASQVVALHRPVRQVRIPCTFKHRKEHTFRYRLAYVAVNFGTLHSLLRTISFLDAAVEHKATRCAAAASNNYFGKRVVTQVYFALYWSLRPELQRDELCPFWQKA